MSRLRRTTRIDAPPEEVWRWHARPGALERLLPPWREVRVTRRDPELREGARVELELRLGPVRRRWIAVHREVVPERRFVDEALESPFRAWRHDHRFEATEGGGTRLIDDVAYELPFPPLGRALAGRKVRAELERAFRWRSERLDRDLQRHLRGGPARPLRIAITGASGLVGSALSSFLLGGGHRVHPLVRRPARPGTTEVAWSPAEGQIDAAALEGVDAVVHLAGESLMATRWTERKKRRIRRSRVEGTDLLSRTLAELERPPATLVSASAVGYYGDRGAEPLDESSPPGEGFLATVCREWEAATRPAEKRGIRVVRLRIGVVLTPAGGALRAMLPAFRLGLGGPLGDPEGWMSWIALDDLVGAIHHALADDGLGGPVNAVAPEPVTRAELSRALGTALGRPAVLGVPGFALRAVAGELADEALLASARVRPSRLLASGFRFRSPELGAALRFEMGLPRDEPGEGPAEEPRGAV